MFFKLVLAWDPLAGLLCASRAHDHKAEPKFGTVAESKVLASGQLPKASYASYDWVLVQQVACQECQEKSWTAR